jgi:biotin---protein ligase
MMQHVLVYAGEGAAAGALRQTLQALRRLLSPRYDVRTVEAQALAEQPWTESTALLVLPGGRDLPYVHRLAGPGTPRRPPPDRLTAAPLSAEGVWARNGACVPW